MSVRASRIIAHTTEAVKGWSDSAIVIKEYDNGEKKRVSISIRSPYDLADIERACRDIREYWAGRLK